MGSGFAETQFLPGSVLPGGWVQRMMMTAHYCSGWCWSLLSSLLLRGVGREKREKGEGREGGREKMKEGERIRS